MCRTILEQFGNRIQRGCDARVPQLVLRDLHGDSEIVQERRVNVAELMSRHPAEARLRRRGRKLW
jgi:hypothetical protein